MDTYNNVLFKISIFSTIYLLILMIVSPLIDHIFTSLDEDIKNKENNFQILIEIVLHIIVISFVWYMINSYVQKYIELLFKLSIIVLLLDCED